MYTLLIVDDTIENIDILTGILSDDYTLRAAKSGETALKVAQKTLPDLILLDIMMPDMDGYQVCQELKQNPRTTHIPVIFVTAKDQELDEVKGFEAGAVDYINKPISPIITKARIRTQLALYNQQKELTTQVREKTEEIQHTQLEIIKKLGRAAEYKDNDTGLHIERISEYCFLIASALGLDQTQADLILHASPMHDIGKLGVPDYILQKPAKLTGEEFSHIRKHPEIGGYIIGESSCELLQAAKIIAQQHHEKWNGTGYPLGLSGESIHLFARIVAIADVFDALSSKRPYKDPWPVEKAVDLIKKESGQHFDPEIVNSFLSVLPKILKTRKRFEEA